MNVTCSCCQFLTNDPQPDPTDPKGVREVCPECLAEWTDQPKPEADPPPDALAVAALRLHNVIGRHSNPRVQEARAAVRAALALPMLAAATKNDA